MLHRFFFAAVTAIALAVPAQSLFAQREPVEIQPPTKYDFTKLKREKLGRGVIAVRMNSDEVFVTFFKRPILSLLLWKKYFFSVFRTFYEMLKLWLFSMQILWERIQ